MHRGRGSLSGSPSSYPHNPLLRLLLLLLLHLIDELPTTVAVDSILRHFLPGLSQGLEQDLGTRFGLIPWLGCECTQSTLTPMAGFQPGTLKVFACPVPKPLTLLFLPQPSTRQVSVGASPAPQLSAWLNPPSLAWSQSDQWDAARRHLPVGRSNAAPVASLCTEQQPLSCPLPPPPHQGFWKANHLAAESPRLSPGTRTLGCSHGRFTTPRPGQTETLTRPWGVCIERRERIGKNNRESHWHESRARR